MRSIEPDLLGCKITSIGLLQQVYSRVAAQGCIHLSVPGIDSDDLGGAALEKTVGEATRRGADIHTDLALYIDAPVFHGTRQLQSSTADEGRVVAKNPDVGVVRNVCPCFFDFLLVHQDPACQDERLRALPRRSQSA